MTELRSADGLLCGCSDFSVSRRAFLRNVMAVTGAGVVTSMFGASSVQAAFSPTGVASDVLVVLSLRGGADGMSLVVPHGDRRYGDARPRIGIPSKELIGADELFGLHPQFRPLQGMWDASQIAAIHAVGLDRPNRSHFAAMELVEDADPGSPERRGWLNRLVGLDHDETPIQAVQMGSPMVPTSLYGGEPVTAVTRIKDMFLPSRDDPEAYRNRVASLRNAWRSTPGAFGRGALAALDLSQQFEDLVGEPGGDPEHGADYPSGDLGQALAESARLIRANMGAEVITVDAGSWDMHVDVGASDGGRMYNAVRELALGVKAFYVDLDEAGSNVTVVTISEFGRRVAENEGRGLDHGWGNVMLVMGAGVKGGYYGRWPGLEDLEHGDLKVTNDYRSVLAEIVRSRFDADTTKVFPGFVDRPVNLGFMR
jgi:uncharacterized protein (DUF1501 family)